MAVVRWFWSILKGALNTIARTVVILVLLFIALAAIGSASEETLPDNMVLQLDLRENLQDKTAPDFFEFEVTQMSLVDVVLGLDTANPLGVNETPDGTAVPTGMPAEGRETTGWMAGCVATW